ncbi:hypothetical protein LZ32DRAFT_161082 [Colletotrichum eremochloae]|nr:hypothetical protein LZ32DRAFT_161082 [Colletotrichum eremochloae]
MLHYLHHFLARACIYLQHAMLLHRPPLSFLPSPLGVRRVSLLLSRIEVALDALQHGLRGSLGSQASLHRRLRTQLAYLYESLVLTSAVAQMAVCVSCPCPSLSLSVIPPRFP